MEIDRGPTQEQEGALTPEQWLGLSIKLARERLGVSQEQLARKLDVYGFTWRQSTVYKTETAQRPIRVNEAAALGDVLGIHVRDLIGDARDGWAAHAFHLDMQASLLEARRRVETATANLKHQQRHLAEIEARAERAGELLADTTDQTKERTEKLNGEG